MDTWIPFCITAIILVFSQLPSVLVRKVGIYIYGIVRRVSLDILSASVERFDTATTSLYLTRTRGFTRNLTREERLHHWKQAFHYITRILRVRKRWAATGQYLQQPRIRDLVSGVIRRNGTLKRQCAAAIL
jgi:hypothetical protein